jgi:hypothetical protein
MVTKRGENIWKNLPQDCWSSFMLYHMFTPTTGFKSIMRKWALFIICCNSGAVAAGKSIVSRS